MLTAVYRRYNYGNKSNSLHMGVKAVVSSNSSLLEGSILGNYRGVCQWKQKPLRIVSQQSKEV